MQFVYDRCVQFRQLNHTIDAQEKRKKGVRKYSLRAVGVLAITQFVTSTSA